MTSLEARANGAERRGPLPPFCPETNGYTGKMYESIFTIATRDDTCVVSIASEIDVSNAETFRRYVDEASAGYGRLAISFERCPFLDSTALRPLFAWAKARGDSFAVVAPAGTRARRIFDLVELRATARVCDTLDEFTTQGKPVIA